MKKSQKNFRHRRLKSSPPPRCKLYINGPSSESNKFERDLLGKCHLVKMIEFTDLITIHLAGHPESESVAPVGCCCQNSNMATTHRLIC